MHALSGPRLPRALLTPLLGALVIAACQAAPGSTTTSVPGAAVSASGTPASTPDTSVSAPTRPTPTPTPGPTPLGTVTLTETGCTWAGRPGSPRPGPMLIQAWNHTDDYAAYFVHRLHQGKTWADGVAAVEEIQAALKTGAEWPPAVSDVVGEGGADATLGDRLVFDGTPGTYGVICSGNTSSTGDILTVFLVGPLVVSP